MNSTNWILCNFMGWNVTENGMCQVDAAVAFDIERYDLFHPRRMYYAWMIFQKAYNSDYHDELEEWLYTMNPPIFSRDPVEAIKLLLHEVSFLIMTRPLKAEKNELD